MSVITIVYYYCYLLHKTPPQNFAVYKEHFSRFSSPTGPSLHSATLTWNLTDNSSKILIRNGTLTDFTHNSATLLVLHAVSFFLKRSLELLMGYLRRPEVEVVFPFKFINAKMPCFLVTKWNFTLYPCMYISTLLTTYIHIYIHKPHNPAPTYALLKVPSVPLQMDICLSVLAMKNSALMKLEYICFFICWAHVWNINPVVGWKVLYLLFCNNINETRGTGS